MCWGRPSKLGAGSRVRADDSKWLEKQRLHLLGPRPTLAGPSCRSPTLLPPLACTPPWPAQRWSRGDLEPCPCPVSGDTGPSPGAAGCRLPGLLQGGVWEVPAELRWGGVSGKQPPLCLSLAPVALGILGSLAVACLLPVCVSLLVWGHSTLWIGGPPCSTRPSSYLAWAAAPTPASETQGGSITRPGRSPLWPAPPCPAVAVANFPASWDGVGVRVLPCGAPWRRAAGEQSALLLR